MSEEEGNTNGSGSDSHNEGPNNITKSTVEEDACSTESDANPYVRAPLFPAWTRFTQAMHNGLTLGITFFATTAARRPIQTIVALTALSVGLLMLGFASGGFRLELDIGSIFSPIGTRPEQHHEWIQSEFNETRLILLFFHNDGENVLHKEQTRRVFQAVNTMLSTPGLQELCAKGSYVDFDNEPTCRIWSVSGYWDDHSLDAFDADVQFDHDIRLKVAHNEFANGSPIFHDALLGNWEKERVAEPFRDEHEYIMISAQSYFVRMDLPDLGEQADVVEEALINRIDSLRREWIQQDASCLLP